MNVELLNPFAQNFPENVVATLEDAALCVRYSPTGRFIAAGRYDGWTTVWDAETRGIIRSLEGHVKGIASVSWSRNSKYLMTTSKDWNCVIWDLASGERRQTIRFDTPVLGASFHPRNSKIILVILGTHQCVVVDLRKRREERIELSDSANTNGISNGNSIDAHNSAGGSPKSTITIARFSPDGKTIWAGTTNGTLLVYNTRTKNHIHRIKVANNCSIKHMEFDRAGNFLVLNSTDRIVRVYAIETTAISSATLENAATPAPPNGISEDPGSPSDSQSQPAEMVELVQKLQDPIQKSPWNAVSFSGDGEYILAGSANIAGHSLYIWDRTSGDLEKILEGPKEPLTDLDWHPMRPHIASLSHSGLIHLWGRHVTENYSAFAPGFEELDENIEYEEREDEFDLEDDEEERLKRQRVEEEDVDVDTMESNVITSSKETATTNGRPTLVAGAISTSTAAVVTSTKGQDVRPVFAGGDDEDDRWADADPDDDTEYDWFPPVNLDGEDDEEDD
ncbi:chromatin binding protein [Tulasnella sp. JGI-2019a]|nr:chromatin binding protein [Tulasnella sp. JGI-2019a]KAG9009061.1 chromatin binding protein [Tulasnella sp. JGI-2019a]KAG9030470.1 chromatin binding protein [Tulasnella sp. JGI-2019a]